MGNLAHSTADDEVLENSENKLLPDGRGVREQARRERAKNHLSAGENSS